MSVCVGGGGGGGGGREVADEMMLSSTYNLSDTSFERFINQNAGII